MNVNKAAVNYYKQILKKRSPQEEFPINCLIGYRGQAPEEVKSVAVNPFELDKFLRNHPEIFIVTGSLGLSGRSENKVSLKLPVDMSKGNCHSLSSRIKNSTHTVYFYAGIVKKKGLGVAYPIKNLIGHRGNAPLDVQMCAKNEQELFRYLSSFPGVFTFTSARDIRLADPSSVHYCLHIENNCDTILALEYYFNILKTVSPNSYYPVISLIGHRGQAPLQVKRILKNDVELTSFLKKFPQLFIIQSKKLVKVRNEKHCISENSFPGKPAPTTQDLNSAVDYYKKCLTNFSINFELHINQLILNYRPNAPDRVKEVACNALELSYLLSQYQHVFTLKGWIVSLKDREERKVKTFTFYLKILQNSKDKWLALASLLVHRYKASCEVSMVVKNESELSRFLSNYPTIFRIIDGNVYLIEHGGIKHVERRYTIFPPIIKPNHRPWDNSDWKKHVHKNTILIGDALNFKIVCDLLQEEKVIALDCEGYNLGNGYISLIQIGMANGNIFIIDIWENQHVFDLGDLMKILESPRIVKVMCSCRNDSKNLLRQYGVSLYNVFDVTVAYNVIKYGLLTMSNFKTVGFNKICEDYDIPVNHYKDDVKNLYLRQPDYWLIRPLTEGMISYAALDVASLVPYLYIELLKRLDEKAETAVWNLSQKLCKM